MVVRTLCRIPLVWLAIEQSLIPHEGRLTSGAFPSLVSPCLTLMAWAVSSLTFPSASLSCLDSLSLLELAPEF